MISFPPCFLIEFRRLLSIMPPVFLSHFFIKFKRFFHQLNIYSFFLSLPLGLEGFFPYQQSYDLKYLYAHWSSHLRRKAIVMSWNHVTNYVMNQTWLGQFHIITHLKVDLVICHLTYFYNQPFESIYAMNLFIDLVLPLICGTSLSQTNIHT